MVKVTAATRAGERRMTKLTKKSVLSILKKVPEARRASTLCGLVGHTRLTTYYFGYLNCGRCGEQVGDCLAGSPRTGLVVERHGRGKKGAGCDCRETAKTLTWRDTLLVKTSADEWLKNGSGE